MNSLRRGIFDSIYRKPRATARSRMAENMRPLILWACLKTEERATIKRRREKSLPRAVRARGIYTRVRIYASVAYIRVRAFVRDACSGRAFSLTQRLQWRFHRGNREDGENERAKASEKENKQERERERERERRNATMARWIFVLLRHREILSHHIEGSADVYTGLWQQLVHKQGWSDRCRVRLSYFVLVTHPTIALWYLYRRMECRIYIFACESILYAIIENRFATRRYNNP